MLGDDDIRHLLARAYEDAALTQMALDDVDVEILRANDRGAGWDERAALYRREAELATERAAVVATVAALATLMAAPRGGAETESP